MKPRSTLADMAEFKAKGSAAPAPNAASQPVRPVEPTAGAGGGSPPAKRVQVGLRLDPDLYERVRALSFRSRVPIQVLIERALLADIERQEREDA